MLKRTIIFLIAGFISQLMYSQLSGDEILLKVEDDAITVDEFLYVYNKNNTETDEIDTADLREYLDLYINFRLKVLEAREMGLDTTEKFQKELSGYRKQLAQPYFKDEELEEELVKEAYKRKQKDIRASHILVKVNKNASPADTLEAWNKAMEIRNEILAGKEFGEAAVEYSEDPSAKDMPASGNRPARKGNRGDLGYFTVFDMVYPFENGAYNTPVDEVSMPVRTDYGYHLIYVTDRQPAMGQVQVAHIYIPHPPDGDEQIEAAAVEKINKAWEELQNDVPWDTVVTRYSEDKGSKNTGGKLPWFGANRMVPEFIVAVRDLEEPGEYTKPVKTPFGWHIIKLLEREPVGTFEDEELGIRNRLIKDQRYQLTEDVIIHQIKEEYGFEEFPSARQELLESIDTTLLSGNYDPEKAAGMDNPLFTLGEKEFTQYDFAKYFSKKQNRRITDIPFFFNEQYDNYKIEMITGYEDKKLEEKYPEFRMLVKEYYEGILLFDLTDEKVWSKAVKDTVGLKEFYEANKGKYMWDKRLDATIYTIQDDDKVNLDTFLDLAKDETPMNDVLARFNAESEGALTADSGYYSKGDNNIIDEIKWKRGLSSPVSTPSGTTYVYVHEVLKPMPKEIVEARGLITADYQEYLENKWITELKDKYSVTVNEEIFRQIK
jgi:peptidyl-prolyl cis-trans isomerase SurA